MSLFRGSNHGTLWNLNLTVESCEETKAHRGNVGGGINYITRPQATPLISFILFFLVSPTYICWPNNSFSCLHVSLSLWDSSIKSKATNNLSWTTDYIHESTHACSKWTPWRCCLQYNILYCSDLCIIHWHMLRLRDSNSSFSCFYQS